MVKSDEVELLRIAQERLGVAGCLACEIKTNRHVRILRKWHKKGLWEYDESIDSGGINLGHNSPIAISCGVGQARESYFD